MSEEEKKAIFTLNEISVDVLNDEENEAINIITRLIKKQDKIMKILIEPNIKMLKLMRNKMPRKVDLREQDLVKMNQDK